MSKKQITMKETKNGVTMPPSSLSRIGWISMILCCASRASAFHSPSTTPFAILSPSASRSADNTECALHLHVNAFEGRDECRKALSRKSTSRLLTRLQYRDGDDDSSSTLDASHILGAGANGWWNSIFSKQPEDTKGDQEVVDEYLEFLDRRYRRLHSDEKEEEKGTGFSAMNWLLQGQPKRNEVVADSHRQEDALYVLGVAGLASQKLLQKHSLVSETSVEPESIEEPMFLNALDVSSENDTASAVFIRKVVFPVLRVLYVVQRRKQMFIKAQSHRAMSLLKTGVRSVARSLIQGPIVTTKAVLEIGGGKKNISITIATVSTVLLLLRPILKAVFSEGPMSA